MQADPKGPEWAQAGNLVWCLWAPEPPYLGRRGGYVHGGLFLPRDHLWFEEWYDRLHSRELVEKMADLGTTVALVHFYHGFGLEFERREMERTRALSELCREHGIRVMGHVELGMLYYEALLTERPDAEQWFGRYQERDRPWTVLAEPACPGSEELLTYLKDVCRAGIEDAGLAGVHFDSRESQPCMCERCLGNFRSYLATRFADPVERFGLPSFDHVRLPPTKQRSGWIRDPIAREWVRFRCDQFSRVLLELGEYAKSLGPDIVVSLNPSDPRPKGWTDWRNLDLFQCGQHVDLMLDSAAEFSGICGRYILSQVRACKIGRACGYRAVPNPCNDGDGETIGSGDLDTAQLSIMESAAFGGVPGASWALCPSGRGSRVKIDEQPLADVVGESQRFLHDHADLYRAATTLGNIALIYSNDSLALDGSTASESLLGMEEVLLRGQLLYDVLFAEDLSSLPRYGLAIVPFQYFLSQQTCDCLIRFAEHGGALLLTGRSGSGDEHGRHRRESPLSVLRDRDNCLWLDDCPEQVLTRGMDAHIPRPDGFDQIAQAVTSLLGDRRPLQVSAPEEVFVEGYRLADGRRTFHFVNYANHRMVEGATAKFQEPFSKATWYSPEEKEPLEVEAGGSNRAVSLPEFQTYGVLALEN